MHILRTRALPRGLKRERLAGNSVANPKSPKGIGFLILPLFVLFVLLASTASAQPILVEGLTHQAVYADPVSFRVPELPGFAYTVWLDGIALPAGVTNTVTAVDYHELQVQRTELATSQTESIVVQFILRSRERLDTEWGLPPWVPYPVVNSANAEFSGAGLRILLPSAYPAEIEVPIVAWVTNANGGTRRVNGRLETGAGPIIQVRRGAGSGFLPAGLAGERRAIHLRLQGLSVDLETVADDAPNWIAVGGTLSAEAVWPAGSRIDVTSSLNQPVGGQLTIGAGTVVRCGPGVEFQVGGTITAVGTPTAPIVFAPTDREHPWGGFVLRTNVARLSFDHTILWGGGMESNWFDLHPKSGTSHRHERPMIYIQNGARAGLRDAAILDSPGQATHGESGVFHATRTLIQRHLTAGQHNAGEVILKDCALIEFPRAGAPFADADNDVLYLTGGSHELTNTLLGWCLDDGLDSGSGSAGDVVMNDCWIESCFHEGMAWSETRIPRVTNCVVLNCGQGIEAGFGKPDVVADHILSLGNLSGARFGDNYDWTYTGFLRVTNSFLLYNYRDIFGRTWTKNTWTNEIHRMDVRGNWLTAPDPVFSGNTAWSPEADGWRLAAFLSVPPNSDVGVGVARDPEAEPALAELRAGLPIGLSRFATNRVSVQYRIDAPGSVLSAGTVEFAAGETVRRLPKLSIPEGIRLARLTMSEPENGEVTGPAVTWFTSPTTEGTLSLTSFDGDHLLQWSKSNAILESAPAITGPWSAEPEAEPPYLIAPERDRFYRLRLLMQSGARVGGKLNVATP